MKLFNNMKTRIVGFDLGKDREEDKEMVKVFNIYKCECGRTRYETQGELRDDVSVCSECQTKPSLLSMTDHMKDLSMRIDEMEERVKKLVSIYSELNRESENRSRWLKGFNAKVFKLCRVGDGGYVGCEDCSSEYWDKVELSDYYNDPVPAYRCAECGRYIDRDSTPAHTIIPVDMDRLKSKGVWS